MEDGRYLHDVYRDYVALTTAIMVTTSFFVFNGVLLKRHHAGDYQSLGEMKAMLKEIQVKYVRGMITRHDDERGKF